MRLSSDLKINLRLNVSLAKHTSFKIGGLARFYAKPQNISELLYVLRFRHKESLAIHILGGGCNTLFSDSGFGGLVLDMSGFEKNAITIQGTQVRVSAGTSIHHFVMRLKEEGLAGLEFLAHLPGTVGGALVMNAGFGKDSKGRRQEIGTTLEEVTALDREGHLVRLTSTEIQFNYRDSSLRDYLILEGKFRLGTAPPDTIQKLMEQNVEYRRRVQDWRHPSAGSVFKNPTQSDWTVGEMVDRLGLKGLTSGGAGISPIHGNFFINKGHATAQNVMDLMEIVREKVYKKYHVVLEPEIRCIQNPDEK